MPNKLTREKKSSDEAFSLSTFFFEYIHAHAFHPLAPLLAPLYLYLPSPLFVCSFISLYSRNEKRSADARFPFECSLWFSLISNRLFVVFFFFSLSLSFVDILKSCISFQTEKYKSNALRLHLLDTHSA